MGTGPLLKLIYSLTSAALLIAVFTDDLHVFGTASLLKVGVELHCFQSADLCEFMFVRVFHVTTIIW